MAIVTVTFQREDGPRNFDLSVYGTITSRSAPAPRAANPHQDFDPLARQTVVVVNTGAITLVEVQRALAAAAVKATAV